MTGAAAIDDLNPDLPAGLKRVRMPIVEASDPVLRGYGRLVDDAKSGRAEIVRWPARGSRPIDVDTGDQGGTTEGAFVSEWQGDVLYGRNEAFGGHDILGHGAMPDVARTDHARPPQRVMLWHANDHRDVPLALPEDDVTPDRFVRLRFNGGRGLYIHPDVWHEGVFGVAGTRRVFDRQGAVHARVSVDFAREFGCLLGAAIDMH